jgi:Cu-processing system ATP-binding protein
MIAFSNITKRFGALEVLRRVDLTIARGRVTGIVGPNGAGKTTLMKMLLGLVTPTSGAIYVDGVAVGGDASYRERIGYMPQIARFPENLSASELFSMVNDLRDGKGALDEDLVNRLALREHIDKPLRTLSGGTRQKVNACLALLFHPSILVADEPTAGLDPLSSAILKDKLLSLRGDGVTIVIASHIMSELEELCDDVAFVLDGAVRYAGPVGELTAMTRQSNLERAIAALMIREAA